MKKPAALLATAATALLLAGAVGVGVAAADPTPTPAPSATQTATPSTKAGGAEKHRDLARRALHGEVTLGGRQHRVVDFQRGAVTAASAGSVTVRSTDGFVGTYVIDAKTKVRVAKKPGSAADVVVGARVRVVAVKDGSSLTAKRIAVHQR